MLYLHKSFTFKLDSKLNLSNETMGDSNVVMQHIEIYVVPVFANAHYSESLLMVIKIVLEFL